MLGTWVTHVLTILAANPEIDATHLPIAEKDVEDAVDLCRTEGNGLFG